jgi:hypothetical protein
MGNLLFATGHSKQAVKYHSKALTLNEQDLAALVGIANAFYDLN